MGKVSPSRRRFEIRKRQKRKRKIRKLKERLQEAKSEEEGREILKKIEKVAPHYPTEELTKIERKK